MIRVEPVRSRRDRRDPTGVGRRKGDNDESVVDPDSNHFTDYYASLNVLFPLGERAEVVVPVVTPPPPDCSTLDDDGDGVNNCNDVCPGSVAGEAVGPDGCPVPVEPVMEPKEFRN